MNFDQPERALLAGLADVLIPAGDGMPSASRAAAAGKWLDAVLTARPDLADGLKNVLAKARDHDPADIVSELCANDPAAFELLAEVVSGAYFMNPDVQRALGYAGQSPQPIDPRVDYMEDGLLESVIRRGPIFRPTPQSAD
ncbi:MAG: hypothetical protein AB7U20_07170 [Planctomycetaceae bacterium]